MGKTEEGREILLVAVGDEEAISGLARLREATALLADPRRCDEACAERTIASARPIYYLNGGLHSTETGPPEMLTELAYRLAVSERPEIRAIRERVIVLINPVAEPDGRDRAVDWFYRYLKGKTDYDHLPYDTPPYWGHYVFHDNNRDGHQRALALTRAIQDMFLRWHPQVMHDLHESAPLLCTWTGTGPYNWHLDPILVGAWHEMAFDEVRTLSSFGMPGVWSWAGFSDGWGHFYVDSVAINHNAIGRGYETFGIGSAETMDVTLDLRYERYAESPATRREWYRPWPPPRKFRWSLRNNTNYMQTGVLTALGYAATHDKEMLWDFWRKGRHAVDLGSSQKPHAFVIPEDQRDRGRLAILINLLRDHGIEVSRARQAFKVKNTDAGNSADKTWEAPAGTFIVRLDQPYRGYAMDLLEAQKYPADSAPNEPYDDVSWSLTYHLGVDVKRVEDPVIRSIPVDPVTTQVKYAGRVAGEGPVFLLRDTGQETIYTARHRLAKFRVEAAEKPFSTGGVDYPAGSWIIPAQRGARELLESVAAELGLDFDSAAQPPSVPRHALDLPRLAVLHTWRDTQAAGWVRLVFDQYRVPYAYVSDDDVKRGGLEKRFDVILFPHTDSSLRDIVQGIDTRYGPMPYTKTDRFPTHGTPDASSDITGGLTYAGVGNLRAFVERGGLLVTLGGATTLPLDGGFVRDVRRARTKNLFTPGSELTAKFARPDHPLAYGYPEVTSVFREDLPLYETREADLGWVVLQWGTDKPRFDDVETPEPGDWGIKPEVEPEKEGGSAGKPGPAGVPSTPGGADEKDDKKPPFVISGGIKGEKEIVGKPAILDIPVGRGRVLAFTFDPIHRSLSRSDFRLAWNAILNWNDLPPAPPNAPNPTSSVGARKPGG
jgi:hypothetical protein